MNAIREIVHFLEINELSFRSNYDKYVHEQGLFNKFFTNTVRRDPSLSQIVSEIPHKNKLTICGTEQCNRSDGEDGVRTGVVQNIKSRCW